MYGIADGFRLDLVLLVLFVSVHNVHMSCGGVSIFDLKEAKSFYAFRRVETPLKRLKFYN